MKQTNLSEENQTMFHVVYIALLSVFGGLLAVVSMVSRWPVPALIGCSVAVILCWILHLFQIGTANGRIVVYTLIALLGCLYFGIHPDSFTDVPSVLVLLIIMLAANQSIKLIYLTAFCYVPLIIYHLLISGYLLSNLDMLVISRIALGIFCIITSVIISAFFVRWMQRDFVEKQNTEKKLQDAQREKELFLANLSHELRTPINVVIGLSEISIKQEPSVEEEENWKSVLSAGRHLYRQVSDIMDYSELITNHLVVSDNAYEPLSVINDVVMEMSGKYEKSHLDVAIDVQSDMPRVLSGDSYKIKKIIAALLDNAIKYTDAGGVYLYLSARETDYGINFNIDIRDTGIGMEKDWIRKSRKQVRQMDQKANRKNSGLGLGLSIIYGMTGALGGFVSVDSVDSKGTHFHVSIPQKIVDRRSCMSISNNDKYQIACYFNSEKYIRPEVADYYKRMIANVREGFSLSIYAVDSLAALKREIETRKLTHVFIATWEYKMDPEYFEEIAEHICVFIFAEEGFSLRENSNIMILYKPVFIVPVINALNATLNGRPKTKIQEKLVYQDVKALVVDDEPMNLLVAKGVMKSFGIDADTCSSGMMAIEKCMLENYDIIFMDHMMPEMDGIEAMKKIREIRNGYFKKIPIVILTANAVSGAREMFLQEGFDGFVSKPIEMYTLTRVLRSTLKQEEEEGAW